LNIKGKQIDTTKLINVRHKAILDCLGAGFLNLGNDGVGSYALSEGKQSLHAHYVERDVDTICEQINVNLIPQLLALNSIYLEDEDMPVFEAGKIEEPDLNEYSAAIQRMGATGFIPRNSAVINHVLSVLGIDWKLTNETQEEILELVGKPTTRSGDGMESGMNNGTGDAVSNTDTSVANNAQTTT
jgi:phage gp29-like protein